MRIILRADVPALGSKGDVIEVKPGYARNYLVPRGLAMMATEGTIRQAEAMRRAREAAQVKARDEAEEMARQLVATRIRIKAQAGEGGRLFGSITSSDIAEAVQAQTGLVIDRRRVLLDEPIKATGLHEVLLRPHTEVEFRVSVEVAPG
jgi:large subunit ribosomal protein L9